MTREEAYIKIKQEWPKLLKNPKKLGLVLKTYHQVYITPLRTGFTPTNQETTHLSDLLSLFNNTLP